MSLHDVARDGNLEELKKLISAGQDLNSRDKHHRTALVMASWAGKVNLRAPTSRGPRDHLNISILGHVKLSYLVPMPLL